MELKYYIKRLKVQELAKTIRGHQDSKLDDSNMNNLQHFQDSFIQNPVKPDTIFKIMKNLAISSYLL